MRHKESRRRPWGACQGRGSGGLERRGLWIAAAGVTDQAIRDRGSIRPQRPGGLGHLEEIGLLLEQGRDLRGLLRTTVQTAVTEQKPYVRGG